MKSRSLNLVYAIVVPLFLAAMISVAVFSAGLGRRDWGTLELSLSDNPTTLDPALIKDVSGGRLAALLYPNLLRYDATDALAGDITESWDISTDGSTYTFRIRKSATFADGTPITARDCVASFERALCPDMACPRAWVLTPIKGAQAFHEGRSATIDGLAAPDDATLAITLEKPSGTFPSLLTMPQAAILPASTPRRFFWGVEAFPVQGGPYRIARLEPDISLMLEANPHYYLPSTSPARIRYRVIRNPFAVVSEFRQGRLDIIEIPDAFDRYFLEAAKWGPYIQSIEGLNVYYLGFNCTRAPFDNRELRRSICRVIDRRSIVDAVLHGKATVAAGPVPPGLAGYDPAFAGLSYDPDAARTGIAAGGAAGRTLSILVLANADTIIVAEAIAGQLRAAGLSVEVAPREKGTFKALLRDGDFDMVYYSWVADYADAENFLVPLFGTSDSRAGGNYTAYSSAQVDGLLAEASATPDAAARSSLYRRAAAAVVEDAPRAFLWHAKRTVVNREWVDGYRPVRMYSAERFEGVSIRRPQ